MRHPAAYYMLLLYCTVLMRCAIPVACDALSHIFNEEEHLATIHAMYGSHHLGVEVANAVSDNQACKHTAALQQDEPNAVHTLTQVCCYVFTHDAIPPLHVDASLYSLSDILLACIGQPPESC